MVAACGRNNNNNNGVLGMTHYSARHWYYKNASDGVVLWHVCQLRKTTISFDMSAWASVSVHMKQLSSHWENFHEILYRDFYQNWPGKLKFCWNQAKISGTLFKDLHMSMTICCCIMPWLWNLPIKFAEEIKTFSCQIYFPKNHAVYKAITKNTARPGKP